MGGGGGGGADNDVLAGSQELRVTNTAYPYLCNQNGEDYRPMK